ncbi:unnamed protein product [Notodromas monacha]|uniref:Serum response factor homolog n=1 Tax=Notodromas monacha TaxID=399045 RepID=A0A7R9BXQ7_9CRUS|nr:unnamed protein product [Notodromas monacha]CAG0922558.1 unnamed protein product [Notodromas monacha]
MSPVGQMNHCIPAHYQGLDTQNPHQHHHHSEMQQMATNGLKRTEEETGHLHMNNHGMMPLVSPQGGPGGGGVSKGQDPQPSTSHPRDGQTKVGLPNGKKTKGRVKIKMEFIDNKLRRYTTFSKRKTGIMKKAYELSTLTGTQVMLLVASETGHVYTFATRKLQPMITSDTGKDLIQMCLNSPDPPSDRRCLANDPRGQPSGFEETDLTYSVDDQRCTDDNGPDQDYDDDEDQEMQTSPGCEELGKGTGENFEDIDSFCSGESERGGSGLLPISGKTVLQAGSELRNISRQFAGGSSIGAPKSGEDGQRNRTASSQDAEPNSGGSGSYLIPTRHGLVYTTEDGQEYLLPIALVIAELHKSLEQMQTLTSGNDLQSPAFGGFSAVHKLVLIRSALVTPPLSPEGFGSRRLLPEMIIFVLDPVYRNAVNRVPYPLPGWRAGVAARYTQARMLRSGCRVDATPQNPPPLVDDGQ